MAAPHSDQRALKTQERTKLILICAIISCALLTGPVSAYIFADGNWTEITSNASFGPRYDFGTATFNERLWVIGGHTRDGFFWGCLGNTTCDTNDIWSSADGKTWDQITPDAPFGPRSGMGVAEFNNRLWVIGGTARIGGNTEGVSKNDVWSSADGMNWTLVTPSAEFSPRGDLGVAVFNNRLWVIAGGTEGDMKNDVWSSSDGMNWTQVTANAKFSPRFGKGVAVFDNKIWMIGGISDSEYTDGINTYISEGGSQDVWSSSDGKTWVLDTPSASFYTQEFPSVTVFDNKIWILGGGLWETMTMQPKYPPPHAYNQIWSSTDGVNWTFENGSAGFCPRFLSGVTVFHNGIWVIGGTDNYDMFGDVWYMPRLAPSPTPTTVSLSSVTSSVPVAVSATTTQAGSDPFSGFVVVLTALGLCGYVIKNKNDKN